MDLKRKIKNAVESDTPDISRINAILYNLLKYFNKLYDNKKNEPSITSFK